MTFARLIAVGVAVGVSLFLSACTFESETQLIAASDRFPVQGKIACYSLATDKAGAIQDGAPKAYELLAGSNAQGDVNYVMNTYGKDGSANSGPVHFKRIADDLYLMQMTGGRDGRLIYSYFHIGYFNERAFLVLIPTLGDQSQRDAMARAAGLSFGDAKRKGPGGDLFMNGDPSSQLTFLTRLGKSSLSAAMICSKTKS